jgi:tetratricopeptide (TPR) repeat protein
MPKNKRITERTMHVNSDSKFKKYIPLSIILIISFITYIQSINFPLLIWDDNLYVTENIHIRGLSLANFKLFFTEFYAGNYQPLTIISYAIEFYFTGLSSWLYHVTNIVFHIINAILVFMLIKKLAPTSDFLPLFVAAFFAIHPMKVESVVWISERKDVLYGFFFLLSMICYCNYLLSKKVGTFILSSVFFICSCLSKSAAVIIPVMMFAFDYYFERKITIKTILEKVPLLIISVIFGGIAIISQKAAMPTVQIFPIDYKILIVSNAFTSYILKAIVPSGLSALYPYPAEIPNAYYLSLIIACGLIFSVIYFFKKSKAYVFGMLFFIISIILVLQIKMVGNATMADRYTYIPYIGLFFSLGILIEKIFSQQQAKKTILILGIIIFTGLTYARTRIWENDETLFTDLIEKYPSSTIGLNNRGVYYMRKAVELMTDTTEKASGKLADLTSAEIKALQYEYLQKSMSDFESVFSIDSNYKDLKGNMALAKYYMREYQFANSTTTLSNHQEAIEDYTKALEASPKNADIYYNRGNSKKELNDLAGAMKDYDTAIILKPDYLKAYNNRSIIRCLLKDYKGTVEDYDKMIELNPMDTTTRKNRLIIMGLINKRDE